MAPAFSSGMRPLDSGVPLRLENRALQVLAVEQSDVAALAVAIADGEVAGAAPPMQGTPGVLAAEEREVVHGEG